jgi:hypothetical protein
VRRFAERLVETCGSNITFVMGLTGFELGTFIGSLNLQKAYLRLRPPVFVLGVRQLKVAYLRSNDYDVAGGKLTSAAGGSHMTNKSCPDQRSDGAVSVSHFSVRAALSFGVFRIVCSRRAMQRPQLFLRCIRDLEAVAGGSFGIAKQFTLSIFSLTNVGVFGVSCKLPQSHAARIFNA